MAKNYLLKCGKLFDGIHDELFEDMEIFVEGTKIGKVEGIFLYLRERKKLTLPDYECWGMIHAHVHGNLMRRQEMDTILYQSEGYSTLAFLHTAERSLERGFTTIRCNGMGPLGYGIVDVKKGNRSGTV